MSRFRVLAFILASLACASCITTESLRTAIECTRQRVVVAENGLKEIARLSATTPMPERMIEPLQRSFSALSGIHPWTTLMRRDVGDATAIPDIMTSEEIAEQALYRNRLEFKQRLKEALPIDVEALTSEIGVDWAGVGERGLVGLAITGLGIFLKKKSKEAAALRVAKEVSDNAANEALEVIGASSDPAVKSAAGNKPNLTRKYAELKNSEYEMRVAQMKP